jgi:hypothetical protein
MELAHANRVAVIGHLTASSRWNGSVPQEDHRAMQQVCVNSANPGEARRRGFA